MRVKLKKEESSLDILRRWEEMEYGRMVRKDLCWLGRGNTLHWNKRKGGKDEYRLVVKFRC